MKKLIFLALIYSSAYGQKCDTCYPILDKYVNGRMNRNKREALLNRYVDCIIKKNSTQELRTDDTVRIVEKCNYIFNQDSTQLTYVCGSDSMVYEEKVKEVKPSPFSFNFENFVGIIIFILFIIGCFWVL